MLECDCAVELYIQLAVQMPSVAFFYIICCTVRLSDQRFVIKDNIFQSDRGVIFVSFNTAQCGFNLIQRILIILTG